MKEEKTYDAVVVGAGSGLIVARELAKGGKTVALIESGPFGGTCVNRGCIPSKMLIYPADRLHAIRDSEKLNIDVKEAQPHFAELVDRVTKTIDGIAEKTKAHYQKDESVDVYPAKGLFVKKDVIEVGETLVKGKAFYLALGARPKIPPIQGLENAPFMTSKQALRSKTLPKKLAIIGGGFIAAEMAHFFATMGSDVEIFSRSAFLKNLDDDIRKDVMEGLSPKIKLHEFAEVDRVAFNEGEFAFEWHDKFANLSSQSDALLVATGLQANTDGIGLENTAVELDKSGYIRVDSHLKTSQDNIWALGDCLGRHQFRHMANFEAEYLIAQALKKNSDPIQYPPVPFANFTHPQVGVVGKTEKELKEAGHSLYCGLAKFTDMDMGKARELKGGVVKLIFDQKTDKLLSAHISGDEAATLIQILITYIHMGATLEDIRKTIFIHPALPEVISIAASNAKLN